MPVLTTWPKHTTRSQQSKNRSRSLLSCSWLAISKERRKLHRRRTSIDSFRRDEIRYIMTIHPPIPAEFQEISICSGNCIVSLLEFYERIIDGLWIWSFRMNRMCPCLMPTRALCVTQESIYIVRHVEIFISSDFYSKFSIRLPMNSATTHSDIDALAK